MDDYKEENIENNEKKGFRDVNSIEDNENVLYDDENHELLEFTGYARTDFLSQLNTIIFQLQNKDPYFFIKGIKSISSFLTFKDNTQPIELLFDTEIVDYIIQSDCYGTTNLIYEIMCKIAENGKEFCDKCLQHYLLNKIIDTDVLFVPELTCLISNLLSIIFQKSQLSLALIYSSPLFDIIDERFESIGDNDVYLSIAHLVNDFIINAKLKPTLEKSHELYLENSNLEQFFANYDNSSHFFNESKIEEYQNHGICLYPETINTHIFHIVMKLIKFKAPEVQEIFSLGFNCLSLMIQRRSLYYDDVLSNTSFISLFADLDFLFSLDIETNKKITKVLDYLFEKIDKTIDIQFAEHLFQYLIHWCVITDDSNFYDSITSTIINLLVCFSEKHSFQSMFSQDFVELLKERIFNADYKIKANSLLLFMRLASEFDASIITEEIMNVVISFLDPLSNNFSISHLLLNDLYVIFFNERNSNEGEGEELFLNMFSDNGGIDAIEELLDIEDNKEVQEIAEKIFDEFINEPDVVLNLDDD